LRWSLFDRTAAHSLQACTCLFVDPVGNPARLFFAMLDAGQRRGELSGVELRHLLAGGTADGCVGRDETHALLFSMLGCEPFQERIGVRSEAHLERAVLLVAADAVEDHDAADAPYRNEAREQVDELAPILQP
jgi:hypothetical protein